MGRADSFDETAEHGHTTFARAVGGIAADSAPMADVQWCQ